MIKLKSLLTEYTAGEIDSLWFELKMGNNIIPLSLPIIKKMVGNIKTTKVAHITSFNGFKNFKKLEGQSKGISSFNALSSDSRILKGQGVATDGGVIVILEGDVLINSKWDRYTRADKSGRRWIQVHKLFGDASWNMSDVLPPKAKDIEKKEFFGREGVTQEEKRDFIKMWIDTATTEMLKRKDIFQKEYLSPSGIDTSSFGANITWNEIIVTKVKIKEVGFIEDLKDGFSKDEEAVIKNTKNSVIIKSKDIPNFLKKNGVIIK